MQKRVIAMNTMIKCYKKDNLFFKQLIKMIYIAPLMIILLCTNHVFAQLAGCDVNQTTSTTSFGSYSSLNVGAQARQTSVANAGVRCFSPIVVLSSQSTVTAVITTTHGAVTTLNKGADSIPYQIYADSGHTYPITLGSYVYRGPLLSLIGIDLIGSSRRPFPMYFVVPAGSYNLSAGTYTDTLTINWSWRICTVDAVGLCLLPSTGSGSSTVTLNLTVTNDCIATIPDISFGTKPLVSAFTPVTQTINIMCTKGSTYQVGLSDGANASGTQRRLKSGTSNYINYEIYKGASGSSRWGKSGAERRLSGDAEVNAGAGSGSTSQKQGFTYRAVILPGQNAKPVGTYTDTVILDISF